MKVKAISRNPDNYRRETTNDIFKAPRNFNLPEDPFQKVTEYTRALNATKLNRFELFSAYLLLIVYSCVVVVFLYVIY
ncbi:hypothetical protein AB6A40_000371 [Gnathostoma spinigerum]|uniref:Uncharacterized protein n=1 Tax=Gnathostoma spinigerum TaxID=75299 RepID=A0ABD6E418_9BILA